MVLSRGRKSEAQATEEGLEAESKFIDTPGIRLHYLEWPGSGPPAVLLHGRGLCAQVWRPTAESLASRFRVVAMDLRGHGDSDKPGSYGWEDVAPDLKGFVEGLNLRDILLIGHSRGAVLAALGGSFISDRVRGAILIEPGMPVHNPEAGSHHDRSAAARVARNRRSLWPSRQAIFDRYSQAEAFRNWRTDLLWEYINGGTEEMDDGQVQLKCTPEIEAEFTAAQAPADQDDWLARVTFPIMLITSENPTRHPSANPSLRLLQKAAPSFEHVIVKDAGHFIPQERPDELEGEIRRFVESGVMSAG